MKLVAILGSPHGAQGNTGMLLDGVLQGARAAGADVTLYSLSNLDVQPCRSCEGCHIVGDCPIADDFPTIKDAITEADGVILATPNYIMNVSAQLKALLDRCSGPIHTQEWEGKYAAAIVTSGSGGSDEIEAYLLRALRMLGFTTVGSAGALGWQLNKPELREKLQATAAELGKQLVEAIRAQKRFPEQDEERNAFMNRFQQLVTMQKDHWKYEYDYWTTVRPAWYAK